MANVLGELFQGIADAIRSKTGGTDKLVPNNFPSAINAIETGGDMEEIDALLDEINGEVIMGKVVTFIGATGQVLCELTVTPGGNCKNPIAYGYIHTPVKHSTAAEVFTFSGWSLTEGGEVDASALLNVNEDRTLYSVFTASPREYTVSFYDGTKLLRTEKVVYGASSAYTYTKTGARFLGWTPEPTNITKNTSCYGQWEFAAFATDDWADIVATAESGEAANCYAIGDEKELVLNYANGTKETIVVKIAGFKVDSLASGEKAGITIIPKNALATPKKWCTTNYPIVEGGNTAYTRYGFDGSDIKAYFEDVVIPALPAALRNGLKEVKKSNYYYNGASTVSQTKYWKMWIPSADEVTGLKYMNHYVDSEDRIATLYSTGEAVEYWTATSSGANGAWTITTAGEKKFTTETVHLAEHYVVPGFCV